MFEKLHLFQCKFLMESNCKIQVILTSGIDYSITKWYKLLQRKTVPSQTSDMGKKTVLVVAHYFWLP